MGEMADMFLNDVMDYEDSVSSYHRGEISMDEAYDLGIINERGGEERGLSIRSKKATGPGKCPKCGKETKLKHGKFGDFFGCVDFPTCKGSRNV